MGYMGFLASHQHKLPPINNGDLMEFREQKDDNEGREGEVLRKEKRKKKKMLKKIREKSFKGRKIRFQTVERKRERSLHKWRLSPLL